MKRIAMGLVAGLATWFGSALAAEAQQITPTGPMHIYSNDASLVYTATINTSLSFTLYLNITKNGQSVYGCNWLCNNTGGPYYFSSPTIYTSAWGMQEGDVINFHTVVQFSPLNRWINDFSRTVEKSITMITPSKTESMLAEIPAARKQDEELQLA